MSDPGWTRPGDEAGAPPFPPTTGQVPQQALQQVPAAPGWGPAPGGPPAWGPPVARPGIIPLRPLRLGELYDGAFQAVRANPGPVLGWSAVVVVVVVAVTSTLTGVFEHGLLADVSTRSARLGPDPSGADALHLLDSLGGDAGGAAVAGVASLLLQVLANALLTGVVVVSVSAAVVGRRARAAALWRQLRPRLPALVGVSALTTLITAAAFAAGCAPGVVLLVGAVGRSSARSVDAGGLGAGLGVLSLGLLLATVVAAFFWVRLLFAPCALVLEPQPVGRSLRRSWRLTRRAFWRLLGVQLLTRLGLGIAAEAIAVPFSLLGGVVGGALGTGGGGLAARLAVQGVGSALVSTIVYPLTAAVVALLYIDQRMRVEGLDVELARAASTPA